MVCAQSTWLKGETQGSMKLALKKENRLMCKYFSVGWFLLIFMQQNTFFLFLFSSNVSSLKSRQKVVSCLIILVPYMLALFGGNSLGSCKHNRTSYVLKIMILGLVQESTHVRAFSLKHTYKCIHTGTQLQKHTHACAHLCMLTNTHAHTHTHLDTHSHKVCTH